MSVISYQWKSNSKLSALIDSIPKFIDKYAYDLENKILTYIGEYKLNQIYDINEFLLNSENKIFKCEVELQTSLSSNKEITTIREKRIIIITDVYFLLFNPCQLKCCNKNKSKLSFIGELKDIKDFKYAKVFSSIKKKDKNKDLNIVGIIIEWKNTICINNVIVMEYNQCKSLIDYFETRKKSLLENFDIFQNDLNQINTFNYKDDTEQLIKLIEFREKNKSDEGVADLMLLYQKIIEIYSAENNDKYLIYMQKLQNLFIFNEKKNKEIDDDISKSFTLLDFN